MVRMTGSNPTPQVRHVVGGRLDAMRYGGDSMGVRKEGRTQTSQQPSPPIHHPL